MVAKITTPYGNGLTLKENDPGHIILIAPGDKIEYYVAPPPGRKSYTQINIITAMEHLNIRVGGADFEEGGKLKITPYGSGTESEEIQMPKGSRTKTRQQNPPRLTDVEYR